jgi:uncharacterized membrane protein
MKLLRAYVVVLVVFAVVDAVWLSLVAAPMFQATLGDMLRATPNIGAIVAFYLIYPAGVLALAVLPAVEKQSLRDALIKGAILGFVAYSTFDLTAHAVLNRWTWAIALPDMAWGTVLTAFTAWAGFVAMAGSRGSGAGASR